MSNKRRLAISVAATVLAVLIFGPGRAWAQLSGDVRSEFVKGSVEACNNAATRDHPEVGTDKIKDYCQCMAEKEADMTTQADIDYVNQHQVGSDDYKQRIMALAPACRAAAGIK